MGLHKRHLANDQFTGNEVQKYYVGPDPSLSAKIADAIGSVITSVLAAFGFKR